MKLGGQVDVFGDKFPKIIVDFYNYVISLNLNDEISFFNWKGYLAKVLTVDYLQQPYHFMQIKGKTVSGQLS